MQDMKNCIATVIYHIRLINLSNELIQQFTFYVTYFLLSNFHGTCHKSFFVPFLDTWHDFSHEGVRYKTKACTQLCYDI